MWVMTTSRGGESQKAKQQIQKSVCSVDVAGLAIYVLPVCSILSGTERTE